MNVIGGNLSAAGSAAVGAAAAIPIVTKETHAFIGDGAHVTAGAASGLTVGTGAFTITQVDPRFDPSTPGLLTGGSVFNLDPNLVASFREDERVIYDNGGSPSIGGLQSVEDNPNSVYYVHIVSPTAIQLLTAPGGFTADSGVKSCSGVVVCGLSAPSAANRGESHRFVPTDQGGVREDTSPRFNPQNGIDVNTGTDTITLPYTFSGGLSNDDQVLYSSGDGQAIGGLVNGQTYYAENVSIGAHSTTLQLSATKGGSIINLTSTGTGTSHSIVKGGDTPSGDASETGPRVITPNTTSADGVAVTATNSDDIAAVGIAAGFSGEAAVNLSGAVAVVTANTSAYVGKSAEIDSAGDVKVAAGNQYHELGIAASIAIAGGAGVGVGVGVRLLNLNTDAFIDNSAVVNAGGNVSVIATGQESIIAVVAGVGGGEVGVAGTVDVTILNVHTFASTGTNVTIVAGNNVLVSAQDDTKLVLITASLAGGYVGIGVAVGVASVSKDTEAFIGVGSNVDAKAAGAPISGVYDGNFTGSGGFETASFDGLAVQSASSENVFGLSASAGGGFVGVAGGVGVTLLHVTTQAFVGSGAIADSDGGSVNVAAVDSFTSLHRRRRRGRRVRRRRRRRGHRHRRLQRLGLHRRRHERQRLRRRRRVRSVDEGREDVRAEHRRRLRRRRRLRLRLDGRHAAGHDVQRRGRRTRSRRLVVHGRQRPAQLLQEGRRRHLRRQPVRREGRPPAERPERHERVGGQHQRSAEQRLDRAGQRRPGGLGRRRVRRPRLQEHPERRERLVVRPGAGVGRRVVQRERQGQLRRRHVHRAAATSRAPAPGRAEPSYHLGDIVSFGGQDYSPQVDHPSTAVTDDPASNTAQWQLDDPGHDRADWQLNSSSDAMTNTRVANALTAPKSTITSAAPTGNVASDALTSVVPAGTSASIQGNVVAGGGVHVRAKDNLTVNGIAGSIAVGFVGVGAAVLVMNVHSATEAEHRRRLERHRRLGRLGRRHRRGFDERERLRSRVRRHRRLRRGRRAGRSSSTTPARRTRTSTTARPSTRPAAASS